MAWAREGVRGDREGRGYETGGNGESNEIMQM